MGKRSPQEKDLVATFVSLNYEMLQAGGWHGLGAPHTIIGNPIIYGGKSVTGPTSFSHFVMSITYLYTISSILPFM